MEAAFLLITCLKKYSAYYENNATDDNEKESQVENDVKYVLQSEALAGGPFVYHCVTADAHK